MHCRPISHDEYESIKSTLEVLSDTELIEQIRESREDFRAGRYKKLRELAVGHVALRFKEFIKTCTHI